MSVSAKHTGDKIVSGHIWDKRIIKVINYVYTLMQRFPNINMRLINLPFDRGIPVYVMIGAFVC